MHDAGDSAVVKKLDQVLVALGAVKAQGVKVAGELEALTAEVERNTSVDGSVIALVNGLADQIEALKTDPAKLQALADKLRADNDAVAAAVAAHTPAEPPV